MNAQPTSRRTRVFDPLGAMGMVILMILQILSGGCGRSGQGAVPIDPVILDAYVGGYRAAPDTVVTVVRAGDHLELQVNHQAAMAFTPMTQATFIHLASGTKISFAKGDNSEVTKLILDRDGQKHDAPRVRSAPADASAPAAVATGPAFRFHTTGSGRPTVLLWGGSGSWSKVQADAAAFARVASFDRVGAVSIPKLPSEAARGLHAALKTGDLAPPFVLVGHSFGGALARVFASLYPDEVAGLVLVDPFQEGFIDWLKVHQPANHDQFVTGLGRAYVSDWEGTLAELRTASSFGDRPVALLSATRRKAQTGNVFEQGLSAADLAEGSEAVVAAHREWVSHIPQGRQIAVEGSSHDIPGERPEVVVEAIRCLVEQVRRPQP